MSCFVETGAVFSQQKNLDGLWSPWLLGYAKPDFPWEHRVKQWHLISSLTCRKWPIQGHRAIKLHRGFSKTLTLVTWSHVEHTLLWFLFGCGHGTGSVLLGSGYKTPSYTSGTLHREMVCSVGRSSIQSMPGTDTHRLAWILIMFPKAGESQEAFHEPSTLVFTKHHCELWEEVRPMLNDSDHVSGTCWIYRNTRVPCDTLKILREFETSLKKKNQDLKDRPGLLFGGEI